MTLVESRYHASAFQSRGCYDQIIKADHFSGRLQIRPDAGVFQGSRFSVGKDLYRTQHFANVVLPFNPVRARCAFYAMPQLSDRNRRNLELLVLLGSQPTTEVEGSPFASNYDVGVQNYCHLSSGALRIFRPFCRSLYQAFAFSVDNLTLRNASASSLPVHVLLSFGTRRATAVPFL